MGGGKGRGGWVAGDGGKLAGAIWTKKERGVELGWSELAAEKFKILCSQSQRFERPNKQMAGMINTICT